MSRSRPELAQRALDAVIRFAGHIEPKRHHPDELLELIRIAGEATAATGGNLLRDGWRVLKLGETVGGNDRQCDGGLIEKPNPVEKKYVGWQITPTPAPIFLRQNAIAVAPPTQDSNKETK